MSNACVLFALLCLPVPMGITATVPENGDLLSKIHIVAKVSPALAYLYTKSIVHHAKEYAINPYLVSAIIYVESRYRNFLGANDYGPMQVNGSWFKRLGIEKEDVLSIDGGIRTGTYILALNRRANPHDPCWWSAYNSPNITSRQLYEKRVLSALRKFGKNDDCGRTYE